MFNHINRHMRLEYLKRILDLKTISSLFRYMPYFVSDNKKSLNEIYSRQKGIGNKKSTHRFLNDEC